MLGRLADCGGEFFASLDGSHRADNSRCRLDLARIPNSRRSQLCSSYFSSCFAMLALVLRFAGKRVPVLDTLERDAYGIYLVHYVFVVWLQYALLGAGLLAPGKGGIA
jgi:hypothetical protein